MKSASLLPLLFLVVSCGGNTDSVFDPNTVDPGGDPGPPWVDAENSDPEPGDDIAETFDGHETVISVLTNDDDPDFNALSITKVSKADDGEAELNDDGTITYTPDSSFEGEDSFTYTVDDGKGATAKATVTVTVTGEATIEITSPDDMDVVSIPFEVAYDFDGDCTQVPDFEVDQGCHIHILIDGFVADVDGVQGNDIIYDGSPFQITNVDEDNFGPGEHTIELVLYRNNGGHVPFNPRVSHEITVLMPGGGDTGSDTGDTADTADTGDTGDTGLSDTGLSDTGAQDTR